MPTHNILAVEHFIAGHAALDAGASVQLTFVE